MTSFKEFFLSLFESARERLKNPVIGTFVFAWSAINWRIILILVSSERTIEEKIKFIEENYTDIQLNVYFPLLVTIFYLVVLPYVLALFDWLSQRAIVLRKLISKNHRISDIKHKQEIAAEEWQLEIIREGSPDISNLKEQIKELQDQLKEKEFHIKKLIEDNDDSEDDAAIMEESNEKSTSQTNSNNTRPKKRPTKKKNSSPDSSDSAEPHKPIHPKDLPVMRDIVIRDLAKTESEWILLFAFYSSNYGEGEFQRDSIITKYDESNRKTDSRLKNLSNNLKTLIKQGHIKYINDNDMLLTDSGKRIARDILNR